MNKLIFGDIELSKKSFMKVKKQQICVKLV